MEQVDPASSSGERPCGFTSRLSHLDIDFSEPRQHELVSRVLAACSADHAQQPLTESVVDQWQLSRRLQQLLAIAIQTRGYRLLLQSRCGNDACLEMIEIPLDLRMFGQTSSDQSVDITIDDDTVRLRLPTGHDQRRWYARGEAVDAAIMAAELILSINGGRPADDWCIPPAWIEIIGEQLESLDELTVLQLNTNCPACGQMLALELDLEQRLLTELAICQRNMLNEIHLLASAYHWREKDIFDLSPSRRTYYIAQLERDGLL
jgi:hypothetical protein